MPDPAYPRDLCGYGRTPPPADWPGRARICVQFVVNYEEGGENNILHGDAASEAFLSDIAGAQPWPGQRHVNIESLYEYGSRAGFWRLWRLFTRRGVPVTVFGVATALARNPEAVAAMHEANWEIASHGLKWIDYRDMPEADEHRHIEAAIRLHTELTGSRPLGFYQGRTSANTTRLAMAEGGFLYLADSYADDLPYWVDGAAGPQLIVPYTLDANDMRFVTPQGFNSGDQFFAYLRDSFDTLYEEGADTPKMLSVGLHCRLAGRPGRVAGLARFLDHVQAHDGVWLARRIDVARRWAHRHLPADALRPSRLPRALFVELFGDVFEHTPEIAEAAHRAGLSGEHDTAEGLHRALAAAARALPHKRQTALIRAHPDLAGRSARTRQLTPESEREQGSAGLDSLTEEQETQLTRLNDAYRARFGIPFVMAVKGRRGDDILAAFEARLANAAAAEHAEALCQIEHIALLRLRDRLPGDGSGA